MPPPPRAQRSPRTPRPPLSTRPAGRWTKRGSPSRTTSSAPAVDLARDAEDDARLGWAGTFTSPPVEGRAIWVRPTETTREEVAATLDRLQTAGSEHGAARDVLERCGRSTRATSRRRPGSSRSSPPSTASTCCRPTSTRPTRATSSCTRGWRTSSSATTRASVSARSCPCTPEWAAVEREDIGEEGAAAVVAGARLLLPRPRRSPRPAGTCRTCTRRCSPATSSTACTWTTSATR